MKNTNAGYSQLSLRTDDVNTLRQLKGLGLIPSMSAFVHFLIIKEIQEMKKAKILKKRKSVYDNTLEITNDDVYALDRYMQSLGYTPVYEDYELMGWEK